MLEEADSFLSKAHKVAIIGGGIAGVAAAYELEQLRRTGAPIEATLFEASPRLGGIVETVRQDGFVIECGPDSWVTEKPWARELAVELGLEGEIIASNDRQRRTYVLQGGRLVAMPDDMRMMVPSNWAPLMASPLFSAQAKLAYLREPRRAAELRAAALAVTDDESVSEFVRRHFGNEVATKLAAPLLSGVFGGDIAKLSVRAVMPAFVAMEREHGSLILAVQQRARAAATQSAVFTTLQSGLGTLIDRMAATLPQQSMRMNAEVAHVERTADGWNVGLAGTGETAEFDTVVLAAPAHITRELLLRVDARSSELLTREASSAIIVALAFAPEQARRMRMPRGFGFLVPQGSAAQNGVQGGISHDATSSNALLAATFVDQKFPHRVPDGGVLLRAFFGGERALALLHEPDEKLIELARRDLARIVGPLPVAAIQLVRRWPRSLPQYHVGHGQRMAELQARVAAFPGLHLIGNAYRGVGLPDLVRDGRSAARTVAGRARAL